MIPQVFGKMALDFAIKKASERLPADAISSKISDILSDLQDPLFDSVEDFANQLKEQVMDSKTKMDDIAMATAAKQLRDLAANLNQIADELE